MPDPGNNDDPPPFRGSYGPELRPIGGTVYYRDNKTGKIAEVTVRVRSEEDWNASPQAGDPTWGVMRFDDVVLAVKVLW